MASSLLSLRQLLSLTDGRFYVPVYQRPYVWGQVRPHEKDSAEYLTECLLEAYRRGRQWFLQGITMTDTPQGWELVDGQQRITYFKLLLCELGFDGRFFIAYGCRPQAQRYLETVSIEKLCADSSPSDSIDIHFFKKTIATVRRMMSNVDRSDFLDFVLDNAMFLFVELTRPEMSIQTFHMMNGSKSRMLVADIIKADIMRMASDPSQPNVTERELSALRSRYAAEWDSWVRWWNRSDVKDCFKDEADQPMALVLRLCIGSEELTYEDFRRSMLTSQGARYQAAKHFFKLLRNTQKHFEDSFADTATYNRIRAILLLQQPDQRIAFLKKYYVDAEIPQVELERYYKLSFLGMTIEQITRGDSPQPHFDEMLASLSMADVYHTEAKRDAFNLLLRLNIDEDIKLGRKFDFNVWSNRSLEHIFSKSKVWHTDQTGRILDGNDNPIPMSRHRIESDPAYMHRARIVNLDGVQLSEHCIGNLVLLYGKNNSAFGNSTFEQKKMMFLTPGDQTVFESRNLLHTVCVFAGRDWDHQSIVDNYNQTLKNLKLYYGFK